MAIDFDNFPTYDPLIKEGSVKMSDIWVTAMTTFIQTLTEYLTQYGVSLPPITTSQRDSLHNVKNGTLIYNTTLEKCQKRENGVWVNF